MHKSLEKIGKLITLVLMSTLNVFLLGTVQFETDGEPLTISSRKAAGLLAYLIVKDAPQPRDTLAALFWPEFDSRRAKASLRRALADIKKAVGNEWLIADRKHVQLNPDATTHVDVQQFRALVADPTPQNITQAIDLYRADFMAGFTLPDCPAFDDWQLFEQESLRQLLGSVLETAIEQSRARGAWQTAIEYGRRYVAQDPLNEAAHRQLICLYIADGQPSAALHQYESCQQILQEELDVEPEAETTALLAQIGVGKAARPHNLPSIMEGGFIGRSTELTQLTNHLTDPKTRLLNLVGMGGTGKTTLALQFAHRALDQFTIFSDGIFYVTLSPVWQAKDEISATKLVAAIADALSLSLSEKHSPREQLISAVRDKDCLLIIDNGESTGRESRMLLNDLLTAAPKLKILVTSRERFNLRAEWVLEIKGLPYQDATQDAFRLFVERATQTHAPFADNLSDAERAAIAELCRLTEGIPLALELAAAWVHLLTCRQLVVEIRAKLAALQANQIDLADRHRSMRAVFDQSWDRLERDEQMLLERLAIFANTFDYEAASQVADASLLLLGRLNEKSLLQTIKHESGRRFKLHPLLRQFILENSSAERLDHLSERHAHYYGGFMLEKEAQLHTAALSTALDDIQVNIDDIQQGWRWGINHNALELLVQYQASLVRFYLWRGWWVLGAEVFEALREIKPPTDELLRTASPEHLNFWNKLLSAMLLIYRSMGDLAQAEPLLNDNRQIAHFTEDTAQLAQVYSSIGQAARQRGDYEEAEAFLQFARQLHAETPITKGEAHNLMALGALARDKGELAQAQTYLEQTLAMYLELGHRWGETHARRLLGEILAERGAVETGIRHVQESLKLGRESADPLAVAMSQQTLGQIYIDQEAYTQAEKQLRQSYAVLRESSYVKGLVVVLRSLARLSHALGDTRDAKAQLKQGFEMAVHIKELPLVLNILLDIASIDMANPHHHPQLSHLIETVQHHAASTPPQREIAGQLSRQIALPTQTTAGLPLPAVEQLVGELLSA